MENTSNNKELAMSYYVELDVPDDLFKKIEEIAEESGLSVEDFILDVLQDEADYTEDEDETEYEEIEDYDN